MWEGSYGREPFDLKLTLLRFLENLNKILFVTLLGTFLFGGGYYVKNVLLQSQTEHSATSTYKVNYTVPPVNSNDYYINETTWNTLVQSEEFLKAVQRHLTIGVQETGSAPVEMTTEELGAAISAKLPSDWNIPTVSVTTTDARKSLQIAGAVEKTMEEELVAMLKEVESVQIISPASHTVEVSRDVRPGRAFLLSAILSFFFATVLFLLKELGDDSIYLPSTLRRRYGIATIGTINSTELPENIRFLYRDRERIGVIPVDSSVDVSEVINALQEKEKSAECGEILRQWMPLPTPLLCPEVCETLRALDGILLVVQAGSQVGKPLEYVYELLSQQECKITAAILWNADEKLINAYYFGRHETSGE